MIRAGLAFFLLFFMFGHEMAWAASCPAGKITCAQWCHRYRPGAADCLRGGRRSCEAKGGPDTCVGAGSGKLITCEAWCDKYKHGSESCKRTSPKSCMRLYGSLKAPVHDRGPP